MEKNIFFVISGPKSNYPENLDLIDKKNGQTNIQTNRHPIALYNGISKLHNLCSTSYLVHPSFKLIIIVKFYKSRCIENIEEHHIKRQLRKKCCCNLFIVQKNM